MTIMPLSWPVPQPLGCYVAGPRLFRSTQSRLAVLTDNITSDLSRWTERWQRLWGERSVEDTVLPDALLGIGAGAQEIWLLLLGERAATRLMIPARKVVATINAMDVLGLDALPSPFLIRPFRMDLEWNYSDRVEPVPEGVWDPDASAFLYLARDIHTVLRAWVSEALQDDCEFGSILSYPGCCIVKFGHQYTSNDIRKDSTIQHAPWQTNLFARYFGYEIVSHQPCELNCEKTLELADRYMCCIQGISRLACAELLKVLMSPVVVVGERSFLLLRESVRESNVLHVPTTGILSFGETAHGFNRRLTNLNSVLRVRWNEDAVTIYVGGKEWQIQGAHIVLHDVD